MIFFFNFFKRSEKLFLNFNTEEKLSFAPLAIQELQDECTKTLKKANRIPNYVTIEEGSRKTKQKKNKKKCFFMFEFN